MNEYELTQDDINLILQDTIATMRQRGMLCHPIMILRESMLPITRTNRALVTFWLNDHDAMSKAK